MDGKVKCWKVSLDVQGLMLQHERAKPQTAGFDYVSLLGFKRAGRLYRNTTICRRRRSAIAITSTGNNLEVNGLVLISIKIQFS